MGLFDVSSLFSNLPLDLTIDINLRKMYNEKIINTKLKRDQLKKLLELCTKDLHFSFNGKMFRQLDGVAMGSPLGPVIANIFMSELEAELVPKLNDNISVWLRYVDDTFTFLKEEEIENVKNVLNNFHPKIKFTHEIESDRKISFLDVNINRNFDNSFNTSVFRKPTDTNVYVHWKAHAPKVWKIGTLKGLFRRAFLISSTDENLKSEINFLKEIFMKINKYPKAVVENTLKSVKDKINEENTTAPISVPQVTINEGGAGVIPNNIGAEVVHPHVILPYKGFKGEDLLKGFKRTLKNSLPENVLPRFVYTGKKLGSFFPIKDKVDDKHRSNLVYGYHIPGRETETYHYIGMTKVRHETRIFEHINTDKNSAIYQHKEEHNYSPDASNFDIIAHGYNGWLDRRICESLYARDFQPILNKQKNTHKLELFP